MNIGRHILERRMQLVIRYKVDHFVANGWWVVCRSPLQLRKGQQIATFEGDKINYENLEVQRCT